jgi:hypothetical protein
MGFSRTETRFSVVGSVFKGKDKGIPLQTRRPRGDRGIALLFLYLGTRRSGRSAPRPGRFVPRKDPVPIEQEAGWAPGLVWTCAKNLAPTGIRSPDRPARSQSPYRLSYPGPQYLKYDSKHNVTTPFCNFPRRLAIQRYKPYAAEKEPLQANWKQTNKLLPHYFIWGFPTGLGIYNLYHPLSFPSFY